MRVLIVGSTPPAKGPGARALGRIAADVLSKGDDVEVLAPELQSVAHHYANLRGLRLGAQLALRSRHADHLVLRIQAGSPLDADSSRAARARALLALGAAMSLYREVTIRLDSPVPIPGGLGGRATELLWRNATHVVVASEEDRAELLMVPKLDEDKIIVERPVDQPIGEVLEFASLDSAPRREEVLSVLRERAFRQEAVGLALAELSLPSAETTSTRSVMRPSAPAVARAVLRRARRTLSSAGRR